MSDIAQNALRYNMTNTKRSDPPNPHNGEIVVKQENGGNIIGFDCSGFVCHVTIESGYRINYESTRGLASSKAFTTVSKDNARPGDIILFSGHVGIITEYDSTTSLGRFIHMSGSDNEGGIKINYFIADQDKYKKLTQQIQKKSLNGPDKKAIYYGVIRTIKDLRRINNDRYSLEVDLHINGSNPQPTLKPLGINVYSKHTIKTPNATQKVAKKTKTSPSTHKLKHKSVPQQDGYIKLIKRMWANLPSF